MPVFHILKMAHTKKGHFYMKIVVVHSPKALRRLLARIFGVDIAK